MFPPALEEAWEARLLALEVEKPSSGGSGSKWLKWVSTGQHWRPPEPERSASGESGGGGVRDHTCMKKKQ